MKNLGVKQYWFMTVLTLFCSLLALAGERYPEGTNEDPDRSVRIYQNLEQVVHCDDAKEKALDVAALNAAPRDTKADSLATKCYSQISNAY